MPRMRTVQKEKEKEETDQLNTRKKLIRRRLGKRFSKKKSNAAEEKEKLSNIKAVTFVPCTVESGLARKLKESENTL